MFGLALLHRSNDISDITRFIYIFVNVLYLLFPSSLVKADFFTNDRKRIGPMEEIRAEHECLGKFEVSENIIIRTEDSKKQGAKFLNATDLGNRDDCINLCCFTKFCDVAVFDENVRFPSCQL